MPNCRVYVYATSGGGATFNTGNYTLVVPQGAVASTLSSSLDFTIGNNLPITISDVTGLGYTYKLYLYINGVADVVTKETTSKSFTWTFTAEEIQRIYSKVPNVNQAESKIYLDTYYNGTYIGGTVKTGTCYVANSNPTISGFTYKDTSISTNITGSDQKLLQSKSSIQITVGTIAVKNGATFSKYSVQIGNRMYESTSNVINIGTSTGEESIVVKVIDSRGNYASVTKTIRYSGGNITLIPYQDPVIENYTAVRASAGTSSTVQVIASAKVAQAIKEKSQYAVKGRYKESPTGTWSSYITLTHTIDSAGNITISTNLGNLDINKSFVVELAIDDYFTTTAQQYVVASAKMLLSLRKNMVGINKIPEANKGALQVSGGANIEAGLAITGGLTVDGKDIGNVSTEKTGSIKIWVHGYATIPEGWMKVEGQAVSRTTYAELYALIGTMFGAGDGSTTFNVPNMMGRVPVGYNGSDSDFNAVGKTGGAKTHTLSTAEMPVHSHSISSSGAHTHTFTGWLQTSVSSSTTYQSVSHKRISGDGTATPPSMNSSGGHTHSPANAGSGGAHNNMQPYIAFLWIMKY